MFSKHVFTFETNRIAFAIKGTWYFKINCTFHPTLLPLRHQLVVGLLSRNAFPLNNFRILLVEFAFHRVPFLRERTCILEQKVIHKRCIKVLIRLKKNWSNKSNHMSSVAIGKTRAWFHSLTHQGTSFSDQSGSGRWWPACHFLIEYGGFELAYGSNWNVHRFRYIDSPKYIHVPPKRNKFIAKSKKNV